MTFFRNIKNIKKVALVNPRGAGRSNQGGLLREIFPRLCDDLVLIGDDTEHVPHLGLLTMAALLPDSTEVVYVDEEYLAAGEINRVLLDWGADLVCLSAYNPQAKRAYELARRCREVGIPVVMGGIHASSVPDEAAEHVDSVIVGEGEEIFPRFLEDFSAGRHQKFYRSANPADLSKSPAPRFDLLPDFNSYNKVPLIATRGCPHNCGFCIFPRVYHREYRHKSTEQLAREVDMVKRLHREPFISFSDENMLADRDVAKAFCRVMERAGVPWECYCDVGIAEDDELLKLLARSGCQLVQVGLETLDSDNLAGVDLWKHKKVRTYPDAIKKIQSAGIPFMAMFIAGFDNDDPGVFDRLRRFIRKNRIREIDFAVLTPMPGTPLYRQLESEGRILSRNWDRYNWTRVNFQPMKMTPRQLEEGPLKLFKYFTEMAPVFAGKGGFTPEIPFHIRLMG